MPVVTFYNEHRSIDVEQGSNLRTLMLRVGVTPYKGVDMLLNCRGHNFCGTCAVEVVDGKGASPRSQEEEGTLTGNLAIARVVDRNVRLSCQTTVIGDMAVKTHPARTIDTRKTRERLVLVGIASFFFVVFAGVFMLLFFDMIKKMIPFT